MSAAAPRLRAVARTPTLAARYLRSGFTTRVMGPVLSGRRPGGLAIFHIGRCGSTVLTDLLDQHPRVYWDGETYVRVFQALKAKGQLPYRESGFDPVAYIGGRLTRSGSRWFGYDLKFYHLEDLATPLPDYVRGVADLGVEQIISLQRRNYLRKVVSTLAARQRGTYHLRGGSSNDLVRVNVEVEDLAIETSRRPLLAHMDHWDAAYAALRECTRPSRLLELTFEEDIERDPMLGYRKVCEFLDLAPAPVDLRLGRSNPFPLRSMIANYDEVRAHLRGTDREWMLDD